MTDLVEVCFGVFFMVVTLGLLILSVAGGYSFLIYKESIQECREAGILIMDCNNRKHEINGNLLGENK